MMATSSCCPCSTARRLASIAHFTASSLCPGAQVRRRERKDIAGRLGVLRLRELRQLRYRVIVAAERQKHAPEVEPGEPKARLRVERAPVFISGSVEVFPALEYLSEVVVRLRVRRVERDRLTKRVSREIPFLLKAKHDSVIVMRLAEIRTRRKSSAIVCLALHIVTGAPVQRDEVDVCLCE